jgi:hypothetical protein
MYSYAGVVENTAENAASTAKPDQDNTISSESSRPEALNQGTYVLLTWELLLTLQRQRPQQRYTSTRKPWNSYPCPGFPEVGYWRKPTERHASDF